MIGYMLDCGRHGAPTLLSGVWSPKVDSADPALCARLSITRGRWDRGVSHLCCYCFYFAETVGSVCEKRRVARDSALSAMTKNLWIRKSLDS